MPDFTVSINGLEGLRSNLDRTRENIDNATRRLADLGPDSIGSDELDEACATFRDDWEDGLGELAEAADKIEKGLEKSIEAYKHIEQGISDSLRQMRDSLENLDVPSTGGKA